MPISVIMRPNESKKSVVTQEQNDSQNYKTAISDKIKCWEGEQFLLTLALAGRWGSMRCRPSLRFLCNARRTISRIVLKFFHILWGILCATSG